MILHLIGYIALSMWAQITIATTHTTRHAIAIPALPEITEKAHAIAQVSESAGLSEKQILVMSPSYNNRHFCRENITSIAQQRHGDNPYVNWLLVIIDDCSSDNQCDEITNIVKELGIEEHVVVVRNSARQGTGYNFYQTIHQCPDDAIIACVDGDDSLRGDRVFELLNAEYQHDIWLTYGTYIDSRGHIDDLVANPHTPDVIVNNNFRTVWRSSHLKTFYAWLFKKVAPERLMYQNEFFQYANDQAFMIAMLELAGTHSKHIPQIIYNYRIHPGNDGNFHHLDKQRAILTHIHNMPHYQPLHSPSDELRSYAK